MICNAKKFIKYCEILKQTEVKKLINAPAYIEKLIWPVDANEGKVSIRIIINGSEYVCSITTNEHDFEILKLQKIKKEISVTIDIVKSKSSKSHIEILKVHQIKLDEQQCINLEDVGD